MRIDATRERALLFPAALLALFVAALSVAQPVVAQAPGVEPSFADTIEEVSGTVTAISIEDRVHNKSFDYRQLQLDDGTGIELQGGSAESLRNGAHVRIAGRRRGTTLDVAGVEVLAAPPVSGPAVETAAVEGTLAIAHSDDFAGGKSRYFYHVRRDDAGITTLAVASLPSALRGGSRVIVSGKRGADASSLQPEAITILSEPPSAAGAQSSMTALAATSNSVLVIMAKFDDNTAAPSYTAAQAQQVMATNSTSVANYYSEVSYGQQLLNVTVTPSWVKMTNLAPTCDYTSIAPAANSAALTLGSTYNASNYNFVVYLFPAQSCGWAGLAYVGYPRLAFINGTGAFGTGTIAHEMGHNFGLFHAGSLSCGSAVIGGACNVSEYGDPWDTMGNQRPMHFNARQKSILGWIPASSVKTHTSGSVTYTLSPIESGGASTYAVAIPTSSSSRTYWIEYRQPLGFDAALASYPNNGAQIRVARPFEWSYGSDDTEILDMTPGTSGNFTDSTLVVGQSYLDSTYGVNVIVLGATSSALTISVTKGGGGTAATTTALASSANPSTVGASIRFTATVNGTNPTGSVAFKDESSTISGCSAVALAGSGNSRTAACTTNALAGGTHNIVATYSGDTANAGSSSAALAQVVNKATSSTTVTSSANPSAAGASVTFTATVSGISPTGAVNFKDGANSISDCSAATLGGSGNIRTATCATSSLAAGTHSISAVYGGNASNNGSTSAVLSQVVNSAPPPVGDSLVNSSFETPALSGGYQYNPSASGIGWTFSSASGIQGNGSAWGAARAPDGTQTAFIQATGRISQTVSLNAGSYTLSFLAARRSCCVSPYLQPIRVTVDGIQIGSLVSPAGTSFSPFSIPFSVASAGAHTLTFTGTDPDDKTTFIDNVTLSVGGGSTTLSSSLNPARTNRSVTFTATVTGSAPTGTVRFSSNGSAIPGCTAVALSGSGNSKTVSCLTSFATNGTYSIVASYSGDGNNAARSSPALSQIVKRR